MSGREENTFYILYALTLYDHFGPALYSQYPYPLGHKIGIEKEGFLVYII